MRLALTIAFALLLAGPALAQSDDFNPYQAALERMPLAEAEPAIVAAYGPITDRHNGIPGNEDDAVLLLRAGSGPQPSYFVFCDEMLAGVGAEITLTLAARILAPFTMTTAPPLVVDAHSDGISISAENDALFVNYQGIGTKQSQVFVSYPAELFRLLDLPGHCADLAL